MEKWTVVRKYYGFSDNHNVYLGKNNDVFVFDTEEEATECINNIFKGGDWFEDERYGKVRYYAAKFNY